MNLKAETRHCHVKITPSIVATFYYFLELVVLVDNELVDNEVGINMILLNMKLKTG